MSLDNAKLFVQRMREDTAFRNALEKVTDKQELWKLINKSGYRFDECDLVSAMSACMAELENNST